MKRISKIFITFISMLLLPGMSLMAEPGFMRDVNTACGEIAVECSSCHDLNDFRQYKDGQGIYESSGACALCSDAAASSACSLVRPTNEELLADAQYTTTQYFQELFKAFMMHMQDAEGTTVNEKLVNVFPDCSQIAPVIGGDFSRKTGYQVRRVTLRTRNARNRPDSWEAKQLENFEIKARQGKTRTQFTIQRPCPEPCTDPKYLTTKEYEATAFVNEEGVEYFRYMRSITMPPHPKDTTVTPNPGLPCLLCHGTLDQLAPGLVGEGLNDVGVLEKDYPYDMALGYKKGDIRGAWTIKIPIVKGEHPLR